jgi:hypothetical protein
LLRLVIRGRRDVAVKRSRELPAGKTSGETRRVAARARRDAAGGGGGWGMGIKKNPTIILPAKNATTYVEDGTGTLEGRRAKRKYIESRSLGYLVI